MGVSDAPEQPASKVAVENAPPAVEPEIAASAAEPPATDKPVDQENKTKLSTQLFSYFQLLFYADPTWLDMLLLLAGTIFAIASGVPFPIMGIIFGQLLDDLNSASCDVQAGQSADGIQDSVDDKVLILVYIGVASLVIIYIHVTSWSIFSRRLETRLRDRYFRNLLRQDASFFDKRQAGELSSRLNADIQAVQSGTSEKVGICLSCSSFFLTAYIVSFIKDTKLAAMLIALIPAFLIMAAVGSRYTQKFTGAMSDGIASASSIAQEALSHIAVVQAFGAGPRLEAKFASCMMRAQNQGILKAIVAALQAGTLYFIAYSANALAYWQGSRQIASTLDSDGGVSVGQIYTVIFLLVDACIILGSIAPLLPLLGAAAVSFQKLRQDIECPSAIDSAAETGEKLPPSVQGSLAFEDVSFAYVSRPDQPVLKRVSFDCPAGKHTAIVGLSGSGKSTVAGLAARLYDPSEGSVYLGGHNLRDLNVKNLRSFMSLVQQEPSLLDRSILENIALGMVNSPPPEHQKYQPVLLGAGLAEIATKIRDGQDMAAVAQGYGQDMVEVIDMVQHVASLADASGFISKLENGYGTIVGTGGKLVSGGQRQRIALARALIRDPKILILDEATASLDSASEQRIQRAIDSIAKSRTLVAIAHRLSTIKHADNIIVMNNGQIIEQGTHFELMALNGSYAGMVRLQNIDADQHDDAPSVSSTIKGDNDVASSDKDSLVIDKAVDTEKAPEKAPEQTEDTPQADSRDAPELDSAKSAWTVIKRLARMIRPNLLWFLIAIFAAFIVGATFSAAALIFGNTIEGVSPCHTKDEILTSGKLFGGLFFMLAVVEFFANSASWSGFGFVAEKLLYKVRVLSFRALYEQGLDWHQSSGRTPASLLSVITTDAAAVGGFSGSVMGTMLSVAINFVIAIILSHIVAWKIAIVCLVTVPVLLGAGIMQLRSLVGFQRKHAGAFSNALGITVEAVNSFKTISSLSLEDEVMGSYRRALKAPRKEMALASAFTNLWLAIANSTGNLIYAFAYWWGSTQITQGNYSQTEFFIVLIAMLVSAQLWGHMFSLAPEVTRAREAASRILSLMDLGSSEDLSAKETEPDTPASAEKDVEATASAAPKPVPETGGATVTFKDVSFSYPARRHVPILNNMSFTIPAGKFCGLVGPSGAGKSTIMSLVQRMFSPTSGAVEMDGVDISARSGVEFRDHIAVVPQDCALFDGTIRFNVGLGAVPGREASDAEIEAACRLANMHETIAGLPDGYATECGPNGTRLSGGQRQRLAIARALVRRPRLLLLDESTSALDAESERALQEGLERAARGITVLAITHRLHTVRKADVIFVVDGGRIVDRGRHEELVETSESYRINALQQMIGT